MLVSVWFVKYIFLSDFIYNRHRMILKNAVDFIIIAFVIFLLIKGMNSLRKKEEPAPAAPAEDPADIALLKEIRDELKKRN